MWMLGEQGSTKWHEPLKINPYQDFRIKSCLGCNCSLFMSSLEKRILEEQKLPGVVEGTMEEDFRVF